MTPNNDKPIFDRILENKTTFGNYQYRLYGIVAMIMIADGSEMTALSILLPVLQTEWQVSRAEEGALGTALFIGVFLGSVTSGLVADRFGRRNTLIYASFIQFCCGILSSAVESLFAFLLIRGFFGLMIGFTIPIAPTMASELTPTAFRGKGIAIVNFTFTVGKIYSVLTAKATLTSLTTGNWRAMLIASSIPSILVCLGAWLFMKESPRFLIVTNRTEEGITLLNEIGRINQGDNYIPISGEEVAQFHEWQSSNTHIQQFTNFWSLWTPEYKRITTCLWAIWFFMYFVEMGIVFILPFILNAISGSGEGTGKKGLNDMAFTMLAETPSILVTLSLIERESFGRKKSLSIMMSIVLGIFCSMYIMPLSAFVYLISAVKLCQKISYGMLYPLSTELYPTILRIPGFSFSTAFGRLGAATMPMVVLSLFSMAVLMPIFGFALCTVVIISACYALPYDTRGIDLDRKINQTENENKYYEMTDTKY